jgi:hypothetical protein
MLKCQNIVDTHFKGWNLKNNENLKDIDTSWRNVTTMKKLVKAIQLKLLYWNYFDFFKFDNCCKKKVTIENKII